MRRHSFLLRLFVGNLLLVGLVAGLVGVVSYRHLNAYFQANIYAQQEQRVEAVRQYLQSSLQSQDRTIGPLSGRPTDKGEIDRLCKLTAGSPIRLTVVALNGEVLGDSHFDPAAMKSHMDPAHPRPELISAAEGKPGVDVRGSETAGVPYRYLARPVTANGEVVAMVRAAVPVSVLAEGRAVIWKVLLSAGLGAAAVAVLLGLLVNWLWTSPLRQVAATAREIASGKLPSRAMIPRSAELADLAGALNEMCDSQAEQLRVIDAQRENLAAIVSGLHEGVIALDAEGLIVIANEAAARLLTGAQPFSRPAGMPPVLPIGQPIAAGVRMPEIIDLYQQAVDTGHSAHRQIESLLPAGATGVSTPTAGGSRRTLDVRVERTRSAQSGRIATLILLADITDLARAASMKAEFVANASHELRTPLATLRAAVDSLAETGPSDPEVFAKFVAILDRHARRLEDMTNDLLDLHLVETARVQPRLSQVRLQDLADWAVGALGARAEEKQVALTVTTPEPSQSFRSDRKLLELILQNLIDNGIKFTPPQGRVDCLLERQENRVLLRVSDTGCGICPEDQPRVFDRFFQADPSRTGDSRTRGTGLGLAIVKHAAERLGASVSLQSVPGVGTTVTVSIPYGRSG